MTPEQENELVARWMGYRLLATAEGTTHWVPPNVNTPWIATYPMRPPPYRTAPALLWELASRLVSSHRGEWVLRMNSVQYRSVDDFHMQPFTVTFAEAVFAAAVMQAMQGKETRDE